MKRIIILFVTLIMLLPVTIALAANTRQSGRYTYEVKGNGTAIITGYEVEQRAISYEEMMEAVALGEQLVAQSVEDIIIPQMLDGYIVSAIGDDAFRQETLYHENISVTIPNTVTSIGDFAFWNMGIASINIPDSVTYIGKGAFVGCYECNFRISTDHPQYAVIGDALYNKSKKELIHGSYATKIPEGILKIGDYAFYFTENNAYIPTLDVILPSSIKEIGDYAFSNRILTDWEFNEKLDSIGDYAFMGVSLHSKERKDRYYIKIPDQVEEIGEGCFMNCCNFDPNKFEAVIEISANSLIEEIPQNAFSNCVEIICAAPIEEIAEYAFSNTRILSIDLEKVESIAEYAFSNANLLYSPLVIPGSCEKIKEYAFFNCSLDGKIIINEGVECIDAYAFYSENGGFSSVTLPNSLTDIEENAFPKHTKYEVNAGSYAQRWADENAFIYSVTGEEQNLDWLNN